MIFDLSISSPSIHAVSLFHQRTISSEHQFSLKIGQRSLSQSDSAQSVDRRDVAEAHHVVLQYFLGVHGEREGEDCSEKKEEDRSH
ncbi:hypothetical protein PMAYCL1PPCAC_07845, partial [Pristionchus mayeri]